MHSAPKIASWIVGALLAAAIALGPVVAFAATTPMHSGDVMAANESRPCDMPCNDCGDGSASPSCAVACAGLVASIPRAATAELPQMRPTRAAAILKIRFTGREREPDKPPPKTSLPEPN